MRKSIKLVIAFIICQAAGAIGSIFTVPAIPNWYQGLNKPDFNPPNWVFAPVWFILFTMMAVSLYLIWEKGLEGKRNRSAVFLFLVHLMINAFWSLAFFGLHNLMLAMIVILILWAAIAVLILLFKRIDKVAAYLLAPYLLWVSFATVLNFAILRLN